MRKTIENIRSITVATAVIVVALLAVWIYRSLGDARLEMGADDSIGLTPTQIESIKAVGEWEFLSISTEELVDTTRKRLFSDDHLVRIYYGTLRLGVNMKQVEPDWIKQRNDTLFLTLPKVGLLDKDFIDEARTKSFFESGTWKAEDREAREKALEEARRQREEDRKQRAEEEARREEEREAEREEYKERLKNLAADIERRMAENRAKAAENGEKAESAEESEPAEE